MAIAIHTTGDFPKYLKPILNRTVEIAGNAYDPIIDRICRQDTTADAYEEYAMLDSLGVAGEFGEGMAPPTDKMGQLFSQRKHIAKYGLMIAASKEAMTDVKYGIKVMEAATKAFMNSKRQSEEIRGHALLNRATNTSYTGIDGVTLLNTAHPVNGGSYSNRLAVDSDLSESAAESAIILCKRMLDNKALKSNVMPVRLIVATDEMFNATRYFTNPNRPGTTDRDISAIYAMGFLKDIVVTPYLTDVDAWFIQTDAPDGLVHLSRQAAVISQQEDFDTESVKLKFTFRDAFFVNDPRCVVGSPGA